MELRLVFAAAIFLGSYLPLSIILLVQDLKVELISRPFCSTLSRMSSECELPFNNSGLAIGFVLCCLVCFLTTIFVIWCKQEPQSITIIESKQIPTDLINYVVPYIVSFMSLEYSLLTKVMGFALFMVWVFWLSYKTGQVVLNPILIILGWKLYEIKYTYQNSPTERVDKALAKTEFRPAARAYIDVEFIQEVIVKRD
ncbi:MULTISPECIES: hypothetical protein [Pseudomonas]|uniref:Uncharacterized protein n=2 Tax=Pseudomonas TaxID=286 RepID=A0A0D0TFR0_PSEFL|nr:MULTISPECIES: hypothetical protein [Pseudomonas fluorescens group]AZE63367.1 hypothetical protein C4K02_5043 [Pseudomonas synxantha]KIR22306.1 hypothetical protein PFLU3_21870 [Pseudomonas fluorescens]